MMYRMLGLGARELLYGRAELAAELPDRLAAVTPEQVRGRRGGAAPGARVLLASCRPWSRAVTRHRA